MATPALRVPASLDRDSLERYRRLFEESLLHATQAAEDWAKGGPKPVSETESARKASA